MNSFFRFSVAILCTQKLDGADLVLSTEASISHTQPNSSVSAEAPACPSKLDKFNACHLKVPAPYDSPARKKRKKTTTSRNVHLGAPPSWIMAGPDKCGSTEIYENLLSHPQISDRVECKELHFWDNDENFGACSNPTTESFRLNEYLKSFPSSCNVRSTGSSSLQMSGEATPNYFFLKHVAFRLATFMPPTLKLMFMFRDPFKRFISRMKATLKHNHAYTCSKILAVHHSQTHQCSLNWNASRDWKASSTCRPKTALDHGCIRDSSTTDTSSSAVVRITSSEGPWNGGLGAGAYASILRDVWGAHFDVTGGDGRVLVMASEFFFSNTSCAWALQTCAQFIGVDAWSDRDLKTLFAKNNAREHHSTENFKLYNDEIAQLRHQMPGLLEGNASTEVSTGVLTGSAHQLEVKSGTRDWFCRDHEVQFIQEFFRPHNRALRSLIEKNPAVVVPSPPKGTSDGDTDWPWPPWLSSELRTGNEKKNRRNKRHVPPHGLPHRTRR